LYLPKAAQGAEAEATETEVEDDVPPGVGKILVVEDDESVLRTTSAMLTELGYEVLCARNGAEAVETLQAVEGIDLLFTDVVMPGGMSGADLAREAQRYATGLKILLTSGYADDVLALREAHDEFSIISKPFRQPDLARHFRSALRGVHEQRSNPARPIA
jgi:CheY-like chemotaxis protein